MFSLQPVGSKTFAYANAPLHTPTLAGVTCQKLRKNWLIPTADSVMRVERLYGVADGVAKDTG